MSNLELNKGDNFIFAIDVSGSMGTRDCPGKTTRIDYCKDQLKTFIGEASKWDEDGLDIITFGRKVVATTKVNEQRAKEIVDPLIAHESGTDTAGAIQAAYKLHRDGKYQQTVLFVATDGAPDSETAVFETIANITQEIKDEHEFAISFLQVGTDEGVAAFLKKLDDDLPGAKHDIVDVSKIEEVDFRTAFEKAIHDRKI